MSFTRKLLVAGGATIRPGCLEGYSEHVKVTAALAVHGLQPRLRNRNAPVSRASVPVPQNLLTVRCTDGVHQPKFKGDSNENPYQHQDSVSVGARALVAGMPLASYAAEDARTMIRITKGPNRRSFNWGRTQLSPRNANRGYPRFDRTTEWIGTSRRTLRTSRRRNQTWPRRPPRTPAARGNLRTTN